MVEWLAVIVMFIVTLILALIAWMAILWFGGQMVQRGHSTVWFPIFSLIIIFVLTFLSVNLLKFIERIFAL